MGNRGLGLYALAWNDAWLCSQGPAEPVVSATDNTSFACPEVVCEAEPAHNMLVWYLLVGGLAYLWMKERGKHK